MTKRDRNRGEKGRKTFKAPILNISGCLFVDIYISEIVLISLTRKIVLTSSGLIRNPESN